MKDKHTEKDMTQKNESNPSDLVFLIEEHKKEIWEWKKKESEWIKTAHQLANAKNLISELSSRLVKAFTAIAELEKKLKDR